MNALRILASLNEDVAVELLRRSELLRKVCWLLAWTPALTGRVGQAAQALRAPRTHKGCGSSWGFGKVDTSTSGMRIIRATEFRWDLGFEELLFPSSGRVISPTADLWIPSLPRSALWRGCLAWCPGACCCLRNDGC